VYTPKPGWTVIDRFAEPERPMVTALQLLELDKILPRALADRLGGPPAVALYRTAQ
jgi:hypothetical protein